MTEVYLSLSYLEKYVSEYKWCSSCYAEEEYTGELPHYATYKQYYSEFCCGFPRGELTQEVWDKAIADMNKEEINE